MNDQPDAVFEGLAVGLTPADFDLPDGVITIDLDLLAARERLRAVKALERQTELAELNLAAQNRAANALEKIAALFAGCVGVGQSRCAGAMSSDPYTSRDVFYLRTGEGHRSFGCDRPSEPDDDSD